MSTRVASAASFESSGTNSSQSSRPVQLPGGAIGGGGRSAASVRCMAVPPRASTSCLGCSPSLPSGTTSVSAGWCPLMGALCPCSHCCCCLHGRPRQARPEGVGKGRSQGRLEDGEELRGRAAGAGARPADGRHAAPAPRAQARGPDADDGADDHATAPAPWRPADGAGDDAAAAEGAVRLVAVERSEGIEQISAVTTIDGVEYEKI
mmetsp:Transcript_34528/g.82263  ORF Transcript_34528/g.82263 Transcript_34528/m.82263 type:complete len:207 (+) Transcript_34528:530-1150(+)